MRVTPPRRMARIVARASGRIRSSSRSAPAGWPSAATNTVRAPSSRARLRTALTHGGSPVTPAQPARPTRTGRPRTVPAMPWPGCSVTASGRTSGQPRSAAARTTAAARTCPDTWSSERRQGEDLLRRQRPGGHHRGHRRLAGRERPGLVDHQRGAPGQAFQHAAVLDHHPAPRRRGQPRHQGDRRGQDQRARRGHHQDGDRPLRAAHRPGGPGHGQGQRQEPRRVPVGEPDERRLRAFRLGDQPDDAGVGAVRGAGRRRAGRTARPRSASRCGRRRPGRARPAAPRRSAPTRPAPRPPRSRRRPRGARRRAPPAARRRSRSPPAAPSPAIRRGTAGRSCGARASRAFRSCRARSAAHASSARPLVSMTLITAAASSSPTATAPASASSAITSTPTRPRRKLPTADHNA